MKLFKPLIIVFLICQIALLKAQCWTDIISCNYHTFGLRRNGYLWSWGSNKSGQLGIGSHVNYKSHPIQVGNKVDSN